ncbi:MAG: hypothetical protein K0Q79_7 [Flavipsychrobacter sp.]|jgi:hypothetical protein|nr:hypothetical protein [Flavipsychrobacter sp.]
MKKLLTALMITGFAYYGANAQTERISPCGVKHNQVCRNAPGKKAAACYKTKFAENYKVCKGDAGYYICCETPTATNSTYAKTEAAMRNAKVAVVQRNNDDEYVHTNSQVVDMSIPQSQSYIMQSSSSYQGYYPKNKRGRIKVCYVGDNVAANTRAPYEGCPSPQSEGPEVNNQRNLNVANPMPMPPLQGRSME